MGAAATAVHAGRRHRHPLRRRRRRARAPTACASPTARSCRPTSIVVGIGVAPATGWLEGSGLELRDGIVCDATLAAGPPGVYAAGDVARWPNALFGEEMRVEHWTNAAEQGAAAARNLLADGRRRRRRRPYAPVPFFWSDQAPPPHPVPRPRAGDRRTTTRRGASSATPDEHRFLALYGRGGPAVGRARRQRPAAA